MINKKYNFIVLALGMLGVLSLGLITAPKTTLAYTTQGSYTIYETAPLNPIPFITSLTPDALSTNAGTRSIALIGTGFVSNSQAKFNGSNRRTIYINSTKLMVKLSSIDTKFPGKYFLSVSNPIPGGGVSNAVILTVSQESNPVATGVTKGASAGSSNSAATSLQTKSATVTSTSTKSTVSSTNRDADSNLSANAVSAKGFRFMPDTVLEWIFLFVLILLGVVLWRKIYVTDKEKNTPLKHA